MNFVYEYYNLITKDLTNNLLPLTIAPSCLIIYIKIGGSNMTHLEILDEIKALEGFGYGSDSLDLEIIAIELEQK